MIPIWGPRARVPRCPSGGVRGFVPSGCPQRAGIAVRYEPDAHAPERRSLRRNFSAADMQKSISFRTAERGRFHVVVRQAVHDASVTARWPILYLALPSDADTVRVVRYAPLRDFFDEYSSMSYAWMKNAARSVGLFVDFAMSSSLRGSAIPRSGGGSFERQLFRSFARSLLGGTIQLDDDGRVFDQTGLYWTGLGKRQANVLLSALTRHFMWMRSNDAANVWADAITTHAVAEDPIVSLRLALELAKRQETSLLGHIKTTRRAPSHAFPHIVKPSSARTGTVPTFPARYLGQFLYKGFINDSGRCDETACLLAHLIFALGLRKSEPFQLFLSDVQFIRDAPWIFLHHPEYGQIRDAQGCVISRSLYLQRFGLTARTLATGPFSAGWKGVADDDAGTPGYWLPIDPLRARTAALLRRYIFVTRPRLIAARPKTALDHPFLLVGRGSKDTLVGDPYTMSAFDEAWRAAIVRTGRRFDDPYLATPRKALGTTPHGARHFYGRFLFTAGVDGEVIRQCMHHRSLEAHKVYTRLTPDEIDTLLEAASSGTSPPDPYRRLRETFLQQL